MGNYGTDTLDAVSYALVQAGVGQITDAAQDWFINQNYLPDGPPGVDRAIAIYVTPGRPPERNVQLNPLQYPGAQVVIRAGEADEQLLAKKLQDAFMALNEQEAIINAGSTGSGFVYFYAVQSAPLSMGRDERKRPKRCWNFKTMRYQPT